MENSENNIATDSPNTAELPQQNLTQTQEKPPLWKRKTTRRTALFGGLGVLATGGIGGGWAYNRYLARHTEISDVSAYESAAAQASGTASTSEELENITLTDTGLSADNGSIAINKIVNGSGEDTVTAYWAEIKVDDATLVRSAFADNQFGLNIIDYVSNIAADNNAIWAINGDYYGFRDTGIIIRNGVAFRDQGARTGLAFYRDGSVKIYDETQTNAQTLIDAGVWNTLSFGPALLEDGNIQDGIEDYEVDTNFGNHSIQGDQPRTGVGFIEDNHFIFIAVDGRDPGYSRGVTMTEFAQMFQDLGCKIAYNIDGGGSTDMVFNGKLVNNPLGKNQERGTSDILYIAGKVA